MCFLHAIKQEPEAPAPSAEEQIKETEPQASDPASDKDADAAPTEAEAEPEKTEEADGSKKSCTVFLLFCCVPHGCF